MFTGDWWWDNPISCKISNPLGLQEKAHLGIFSSL
jgi:hypothetical protein